MTIRWSSSGRRVGSINALVQFEPDLCINPRQKPPPRGRRHQRGQHSPPLDYCRTSGAPSTPLCATPRTRSGSASIRAAAGGESVAKAIETADETTGSDAAAPQTRAAASHSGESGSLARTSACLSTRSNI
jgi:hypothetical protein